MENWFITNKIENFNKIKYNSDFNSIQKIILANRDITSEYQLKTFLNNDISLLHDSLLMADMKKGVDILFEVMMSDGNIRIVGDYDQDGVAATVILYKGIEKFYEKISYAIPDRIEDGYGLNKNIVDECIKDNISLIITCDNGIAAFDAIEYAKNNNIKVIVTDHHEVVVRDNKDILPIADAVINPHRSDDEYPFSGICGALVAYKFIDAIYKLYGNKIGRNINEIYDLIQFAALGTVCDMMKIIDENRIIVIEGIKRINQTNNIGILSLLNELNWTKYVNMYTIGFLIGPIINASGRIYTAKLGVELFLENDTETAKEYAKTLIELNNERKKMTSDSVELAINHIEYEKLNLNDIIVLYKNSIHESICGLVAGRIKDLYNKPTIILTDSSEQGIIKGSGRSISAYNMFEELNKYRDNFTAFGGHAMACGLSLKKENLQNFIKFVNENNKLIPEDFNKALEIDYALDFNRINEKLIKDIDYLGPYGYGFKEPVFATKNVIINNVKIIGKEKNVLKLSLIKDNIVFEAISFNVESILKNLSNNKIENDVYDLLNENVDVAYKLSINEFNGISNIQLNLVSMR